MHLGRLLRFLDVHYTFRVVYRHNLAEFLVAKIDILPGSYIAPLLRVKEIAVGWHLFSTVHAIREPHARQAHSLVKQFFIGHFRQPITLLPGPLVFPAVPAQQLCEQPLAGLFLGARIWIGGESPPHPLFSFITALPLFLSSVPRGPPLLSRARPAPPPLLP